MSNKVRRISNKWQEAKNLATALALVTTIPGSIFSTCAMVSMEDEKTTIKKFQMFEEDVKNKDVKVETIEEMVNYIKKEYYDDITLPDTTALVYDKKDIRTPLITILKPEEDGSMTPVPLRRDGWPTMALLSEEIGYELLYGDDE